ncbi:Hypothetical_protein [Hexamita inflata]|uniref:Hypothetical_protein n=1 Tax=Hexamita inflata TaxID=28002 RepID=A0AA86PI23_9EUKA|nr:Hypothetical protein HINF_LOCUS26441 [Hexamita inflata]CAI9964764.1 Hypothetical protein HINF_LOCUS52409 [Hexamita inflata]
MNLNENLVTKVKYCFGLDFNCFVKFSDSHKVLILDLNREMYILIQPIFQKYCWRISELERNFKPVPAFNIISKQFDLIEKVNGQINVIQENTNIELKQEDKDEKELTNAELTKKVIKLENTIKQMEQQHKKEMQEMQTQINALIARAIVKQK